MSVAPVDIHHPGHQPHWQDTPKPLTFTLLRLLADGEFHSGEALARQLGISRASVSNALRGMESYGLTLHSVRGRGYCLVNPPQWLDVKRIISQLGEQSRHFQIEILDSAPSSNTSLLQRAKLDNANGGAPNGHDGSATTGNERRRVRSLSPTSPPVGESDVVPLRVAHVNGSVLAVEWQSGGRGRMGRVWHSGLGNALTFSLLWRFDCGLSALSGLSLATGVALMRALRELGVEGARLKWPNDVLGAHGKLAGILIEVQGDMLGPSTVVIGIGLNLFLPQPVLRQIGQPVTSLADMVAKVSGMPVVPERNRLLAVLLCKLSGVLHEFAIHGFAALRLEWESYHALQNQSVHLLMPDGNSVTGIARGVTEGGALKLETVHGVKIFNAGEVSLRGGAEYVAA